MLILSVVAWKAYYCYYGFYYCCYQERRCYDIRALFIRLKDKSVGILFNFSCPFFINLIFCMIYRDTLTVNCASGISELPNRDTVYQL